MKQQDIFVDVGESNHLRRKQTDSQEFTSILTAQIRSRPAATFALGRIRPWRQASFRPEADVPVFSDISLLRQLERVVQFDAEIPNGAFNLGVTKKQLHRAQVVGSAIDKRRLCTAH